MSRDQRPLHGLDLNLLVTLRALLRERSVTHAAERLGQTQPTISRALATLRRAFDDELLVRSGRAMAPTPLAESLKEPLERALATLDRLPSLGAFDPAHDSRTFRLIVPDLLGQRVVPELMERLGDAPGIQLQVASSERDALQALLTDEVDLVLGAPLLDHAELYTRRVGHPIPWSVIVGAHHAPGALDTASWLAASHLQLVPGERPEEGSALDRRLAEEGHTRKVQLNVSTVSAVGETLARTDLVCSLPTLVAEAVAQPHGLRVVPHPYAELGALSLRLTWHQARHGDAGHRWLRGLFADIVGGLTSRWA